MNKYNFIRGERENGKAYFDGIMSERKRWISKIIDKINEIEVEYYNKVLSNKKLSLENININTQRYDAMRIVLEELIKGYYNE